MATMSHTPEQRQAWHDGKRRVIKGITGKPIGKESKSDWFRRVIVKGNFRGGYTPRNFGLTYERLK